jgi:hypothetical protein
MGAARLRLLIRLRPCFVGPARVDSRKQSQIRDGGRRRIPDAQTRARRTLPLHPAGRLANPNAPASRASAGGASSRLPAEESKTPKPGQGGPCPHPPCRSHRKSERHRPRASAGGASSRLPTEGSTTPKHGQGRPCPSTLRVASQIRTPPHHASALEGQAPACPPKNPPRPNTRKEDLRAEYRDSRTPKASPQIHFPL